MSSIVKLENNDIQISVSSMGAELISLLKKDTNKEYMWEGNPDIWGGRSPVLFPIVQSIHESTLSVNGRPTTMGNHGFARKSEFELETKTDQLLVYVLRSSEETLKEYPYHFELRLKYSLDQAKVKIHYEVKNTDSDNIYFQLGTHPGFVCPIDEELEVKDYTISFNKDETLPRYYCDENNYIIHDKKGNMLRGKEFPLNHPMFYEGAHIFKHVQSDTVTLASRKNGQFVELSAKNFPYLGIWQKKDAPFICIEPWYGIGDMDNYEGEFKDKEMMVNLDKGKTFEAQLHIRVG